jgi:hypothetical protein
MTTVAFRDGVMASDSRGVDQGVGITPMKKIFRKRIKKKEYLIAGCGWSPSILMFVDWYGTNDKEILGRIQSLCVGAKEFTAMIWDGKRLVSCDETCRDDEVLEDYWAIGSGAAHAITAMDCGKSAIQAVRYAARRDINTGGRIVTARLK